MNSHLDTALLTVEQAKSNWCPEARTTSAEYPGVPPTVNRKSLGEPDIGSRCLGDGCMYWRWHDRAPRAQRHLEVVKAEWDQVHALDAGAWLGKPDDGREWELDSDEGAWFIPAPTLPPRGYCGKAGHPHTADLIEAQMRLTYLKIYDHEHTAA